MHNASLSHGNQSIWFFFNLALKNPAIWGFFELFRIMYNVEPIPGIATVASVTIHSWSLARGSVIGVAVDSAFCAFSKYSTNLSYHISFSADGFPAVMSSRGAIIAAHFGMTRAKIL